MKTFQKQNIGPLVNKWCEYKINIKNHILNRKLLRRSLFSLMREIIGNGYINHYFMIQFKVVQSNGSIRSISHVQISRLNEIRKLYPILLEF